MDKIYYVEFDLEHSRTTHNYIINLMASNAKDAKNKARKMWTDGGHKWHQFHLYAHRSSIQDPKYLGIRDYAGKQIIGENAMNRFICTGWHRWPSRH